MGRDGKADISKNINREFVWALCQRGAVEVLSSQVTIRGQCLNLDGVRIPEGCRIEYVGAKPTRDEFSPEVIVTFGFD